MATYLYIATAIGLFIVTQTNGDWETVRHTLKQKALTSIAVSEGVIIAGTTDGMMPAPWSRHMVERFVQLDDDLFAVLSNGELWLKRLDESSWHRVLSEIPHVKAITGKRG